MMIRTGTKRQSDGETKWHLTPPARARTSSLDLSVSPSLSSRAFTLVELIISIALVLIVMLGVNFVFRMTGDTIGSGQVLNEQVRNNRGAQAVMFDDFGRMASDGPALLIRNRAVFAFRNQQDELGDRDYVRTGTPAQRFVATRTTDFNGDGDETDPEDLTPLFRYGSRSHRVDVISFFAKGLFRRQTGGETPNGSTGPLIADMSASEAWIWLGHTRQYDGRNDPLVNASYLEPGEETIDLNPTNFYASQWNYGRVAMLLREPDQANQIMDRSTPGRPQMYYEADPIPPGNTPPPLSPLAFGSQPVGSDPMTIERARYDLAGTSISSYRYRLSAWISRSPPGANWWDVLFLTDGRRFFSNSFLVRPISPASYSQQSTVFLQGATQVIVEYAGDFLKQDTSLTASSGAVLDTFLNQGGQDGQIDFVPTWNDTNNNGTIDGAEVNSLRRSIRWYGLPRDTNGDGRIICSTGDVVPLRDLLAQATAPQPPLPTYFERSFPTAGAQGRTVDYMTTNALTADPDYTCAWGPTDTVRPKLIRVTIILDDTSGRLAEGQTLEYVFELP